MTAHWFLTLFLAGLDGLRILTRAQWVGKIPQQFASGPHPNWEELSDSESV